jgi:cardiolipin synthase
MISQIPNFLTLLRIAASPVLVLLLADRAYESALLLFLIAGITDGLDGFIAKRFGFVTQLGAILDPIADKLLILSAYVMLGVLGDLPLWLLVLVGFRDLLIIGGYLILKTMEGEVHMRPTYISKLNTFLQISLVLLILLDATQWLSMGIVTTLVMLAVTATTVLSGAHYVWYWGIQEEGRRD